MKRYLSLFVTVIVLFTLVGSSVVLANTNTFFIGEYFTQDEMTNKNPFLRTGNWEELFEYIFDTLLYFNPVEGTLESRLATGYRWTNDNKALVLDIRNNVKWHDGQKFTAGDVKFTLDMMKSNPVLDSYGITKEFESVEVNGNEVKINLKSNFKSLPFYLSEIYIVPGHIWEDVDPTLFLNEEPVGTGAFKWFQYNKGTNVVLEKNEDYWKGSANFKYLDIGMYTSAPSVTMALSKGEIDATLGTIAMPNIPKLLSQDNYYMQKYAGLDNWAAFINNEKPLLNNKAVRQAMNYAVNTRELIEKGEYNAVYDVNPGWLSQIFGDYINEDVVDMYSYNPEKAASILEKAGFKKGSDGIYVSPDGERLSFTYYVAAGAPAQQKEANMIAVWLGEFGIEIKSRTATWPKLTDILRSGEYDLLQNFISFPPDPYASLNSVFNSEMTASTGENTPGLNYIRFRNETVDNYLSQINSLTSEEEIINVYNEIQAIIADEAPMVYMYNVGGHIPYHTNNFVGHSGKYSIGSTYDLLEVVPTK